MKGVLDRFEGNLAVVLIEEEKAEVIIPKEQLPAGSKINTVFKMEKSLESYTITEIDHSTEKEAKETTQDLMAKLRARSNGSKFKKD
ncbi:DUF3006 domain-containing protein [Ornithinibacillus scapharcae]|uniref:DUF3006 domain-containing protein n=1 Tax=Ornithinibacillus scapharcae TaxID=1147159 RepID=UPI000225AABB|nr:DUF3006 domain-containing protein [Ornithinibacillus scapharcae]